MRPSLFALFALGFLTLSSAARAGDETVGSVTSFTKISSLSGGFTGVLEFEDFFGITLTAIGDLDGDGIDDLAVGAVGDDDGGPPDRGGVWILFLKADGTVREHAKISHTEGDFPAPLDPGDFLGYGVERLDDFDGDGTYDLLIGAGGDDDGGFGRGAVFVTLMHPDGRVKAATKLSDLAGGFTGKLDNEDHFGFGLAHLGDLDEDGVDDICVSAVFDDDGGFDTGAVWILFLKPDGTVKSFQKISNSAGLLGTGAVLSGGDEFGRSVTCPGDIDGDGIVDLAVGAFGDSDGGSLAGAVWILFLRKNGTVRVAQKISPLHGGLAPGTVAPGDRFGSGVTGLGDLDGDGVIDLAVGASRGPLFSMGPSLTHVLLLSPSGTVKDQLTIGDGLGGLPSGIIDDGDRFGTALALLGDIDGDGVVELAVGANGDNDGSPDRGAVYVLKLEGRATANWTHLGPAVAGARGRPLLSPDHPLTADSRGSIDVCGGPPLGTVMFVLGLGLVSIPFKGGVLHPSPDILLGAAPLDGLGGFALPFEWPAGVPPGTSVAVQAWMPDASAVKGFASSNGLLGVTP